MIDAGFLAGNLIGQILDILLFWYAVEQTKAGIPFGGDDPICAVGIIQRRLKAISEKFFPLTGKDKTT